MRARMTIAAMTIGLAAASAAQAENWRASSQTQQAKGYIDTDSIQRDGDRVLFWREVRWPEPRSLEDGSRFDRMAARYDGNCRTMTLQSKAIRVKLGDRIILSADEAGEMESAEPGSTAETDMLSACFGEWPSGG